MPDPIMLARLGALMDGKREELDQLVAAWTELTGSPPAFVAEVASSAPPPPPPKEPGKQAPLPEPLHIDLMQLDLLSVAAGYMEDSGLRFDEWVLGRERLRNGDRPWATTAEARGEGRLQRKFVITTDELFVVDPLTEDLTKLTDIYERNGEDATPRETAEATA